jgi:HD superfamily phosphohydrolase
MPVTNIDPIYGEVRIPDELKDVLECPALSRLRDIKQLGFTSAKYPGAVHTRFEHTLGTCEALRRILDQFTVNDSEIRKKLMLCALTSEIGIFPLSYSSRNIFERLQMNKNNFREIMYSSYISELSSISYGECVNASEEAKEQDWWKSTGLHRHHGFGYLDPVKLASSIDYVMRDAYYTGRHLGGFDYRFFNSLSSDLLDQHPHLMIESLYNLHRAIHSLNITYGDPIRRLLTQILSTLVERLHIMTLLDLSETQRPEIFSRYTDSKFLKIVGDATEKSEDQVLMLFFDVILQKEEVEVFKGSKIESSSEFDYESERRGICQMMNVEPWQVFFLGVDLGCPIGFRVFGQEYPTYNEAIHSEHFRFCTGLDPKMDSVLMESEEVNYVVLKPA